MRLVGDLTTNHCGIGHPWFAERPDMFYVGPDGYESWLGVPTLPKFNWGSGELRRRFFDGPDAVVSRWLDVFDGWRVDVANMTGRRGADDYNHEVGRLFRQAARGALVVAEHTTDPTRDLDRGGWHGTMNYAGFLRPVWSWLTTADLPVLGMPAGVPRRPAATAVATMRAFGAAASWRSLVHSWTLLGSHDTARIRTVVGAGLVEVAAGLLVTMPGTPMVYSGDEIGQEGTFGEDSRRPFPWHRPQSWDRRTLDLYRSLIALRRASAALRHGGLRWVHAGTDTLAFLRETADERLLVLARRATGERVRVPLPAGTQNLYGGATVIPDDGPTFQVWRLPA